MSLIKVLVVENEQDILESYDDTIKEHNEKKGNTQIKLIKCETYEKALDAIKNDFFDAAIVDLSLSNPQSSEGNQILQNIFGVARYPIYIVSGQLQMLDLSTIEKNDFICMIDKGDSEYPFSKLFEEIQNIFQTGITKILGNRGIINNHLDQIFWAHLSQTKQHWIGQSGGESKNLEQIVSRYTLMHLLEYIQLDNSSGQIEYHDPSEMYIKPIIKEGLYPGIILKKNDTQENFLILTPACDLHQSDKCDCLLLVKLNPFFQINELVDLKSKNKSLVDSYKAEKDPEKQKVLKNKVEKNESALKSKISDYIGNNRSHRYYFLPNFLDFSASIIDFQDIISIDLVEEKNYTKFMSITWPFFKDIQSRFSSYYARQGAPDFNKKALQDSYFTQFLEE